MKMRLPLYGHSTPNLRKVYSMIDLENSWGHLPPKYPSLNENLFNLTELIRSIQRSEGNPDCFRQHHGGCDQLDCAWRSLCLEQQDNGQGHDKDDPNTT